MDELKQRESVFSTDLSKAAVAESQEEAKEIAKSLARPSNSERSESAPAANSSEYARTGGSSKSAQRPRMSSLPQPPSADETSPGTDLFEFLKNTRHVWLIVIGGVFGLIVLFSLGKSLTNWASNARERRHQRAVASVTPERLIARCGQPAEDLTRNDYPILMRTMTYQMGRNEGYVLAFSRTAEDKSDWVFLSMKDLNGAKSYDTPDAQVAAMSCLNSSK